MASDSATGPTQPTEGRPPVCLVIGAGDGLGSAIAKAFADKGLTVCATRRPRHAAEAEALAARLRADGAQAHGFGVDAREEAEMAALFERIERDIGPLDVVAFNIGANVRHPIRETSAQVHRKVWEMAAHAGFITGREAAARMVPRGRGTIIFTGATASLRGREGFAAFAGAKHALRALAQSMARELGPQGVHVAHVVVDGAMEGPFIAGLLPDYAARLAEGRVVRTEAAASAWTWLWQQDRSAWTHELDLRPWSESW